MSGKQRITRRQSSSSTSSMARSTPDNVARRHSGRNSRNTQLINNSPPDPEPRRSVRATKGQHKALEQQDQPIEVPKRRGKKGKKAAPEPEEPEEEVIRCVCGATEQDEDSGEPWIACDTCGAWQHNICMGMSQYTEDLPKEYFCEQCRPENHKELLAGIERGEKPWEARRKAYEEEKSEKKRRGGKKGSKKRVSDPKDEVAQASQKSKQSPAPEPKKDHKAAGQKRKVADSPADKEPKQAQKMRKVSQTQAVPVSDYIPPEDLAIKIAELPDGRQGPAKALYKNLSFSIAALEKKGSFSSSDGVPAGSRAERLALQIERAVHDTHPSAAAYQSQIRTLAFNLKSNTDLCAQLLNHGLSPAKLATKSTEELATKELQHQTAEMKAKAEKQAIKITDPTVRMIRKTHKGDEMVGDESFTSEAVPTGPAPRPAGRDKSEPRRKSDAEFRGPASAGGRARSPIQELAIDTQHSPNRADFDINKVFSSVKSPTVSQNRRPSAVTAPAGGPGVDPDIDRMLEDDTQSPPYSPREETDPDAVWRGNLVMNTIANVPVIAKHMGGARLNETLGLAWDKLIPKTLTVCGRIDEQQAIVYLCGLRYSVATDIVVVSLEPTSERSRADMRKLIDYFVGKKRYGVVGDKGVANVRDTYLVPVLPGNGNHPEFMLNLRDNFIPATRTEPMLLAVFVYRNDPDVVKRLHGPSNANNSLLQEAAVPAGAGFVQSPGTPTPGQGGLPRSNRQSVSAPAFSPTSPQGPFPNYPTPRNSHPPAQQGLPPTPTPHSQSIPSYGQPRQDQLHRQGEQVAREVLGTLITSPTVGFLLPQADKMTRREWELIRGIYERDPKARDDLPYLSSVLEKQGTEQTSQPSPAQTQQPVPGPAQQHQQQRQPSQPHPHPQPQFQPQPQPQQTPQAKPPQPQPPAPQQQQVQHRQPPAQQPAQPQPQPQAHPSVIRNTPIPPPPIPGMPSHPMKHAPPVRQTPIPPPPIPPQAVPAATAAPPTNPPA